MKLSKPSFLFASLAFLLCVLSLPVFADNESAEVTVTIANGSLMLAQEPVSVTDTDGDGVLTISDALSLAHEAKFEGGAAAGYETEDTEWGLSLTKLWGVENGGSCGYYVNNTSAMSLLDPIRSGDFINAFNYTDTDAFSDLYTFFDVQSASVKKGETLELTLSAAAFDENWAPVVLPVSDAVILINGEETSFKTDADGKAAVKIDAKENCLISAKSDNAILVPPALTVTVEAPSLNSGWIIGIAAAVIAAAAVAFFLSRKK